MRNVIVVAGGTAFGQVLVVAVSPILTRLYSPNEFGIWATYTSILALLSVVASLRYEMAIPIPESDTVAASLLILSLLLLLFNIALLFIGIAAFGKAILFIGNSSAIEPYKFLIPLGFAGAGLYQLLSYWPIRKRTYGVIANTRLTQSVASVSCQLGLGIAGCGVWGLLFAHIAAQACGVTTLISKAWNESKDEFKRLALSDIRSAASRYRRFPLYMSPASFLNSAGVELPTLLLAATYGSKTVGAFFIAQRVFGLPLQLIGASVSQVFMGEAADLARTNPLRLQTFFNRASARLLMLGLIPGIVFLIGGASIFVVVFGEAWLEAGRFIQILALPFLLQFSLDSLMNFAILERQDLSLIWTLSRLLLVTAAIMIPSLHGMSSLATITSYSAAMITAYIVKCVLWKLSVRRLILTHTCSP